MSETNGRTYKLHSFGWVTLEDTYQELLYIPGAGRYKGYKIATEYWEREVGRQAIALWHGNDVLFESDIKATQGKTIERPASVLVVDGVKIKCS